MRPKILRPCPRPAASSTPLPGLPPSPGASSVSPFRLGLRLSPPFAKGDFPIRLLTRLNHYLNATSSLTSRKANTQTETMLPRSQPSKASPQSPFVPSDAQWSPRAFVRDRPPAPVGPPFAKGDFSPAADLSLICSNKKQIRPEPGPRKNLRRTRQVRYTKHSNIVYTETSDKP